MTKVYYKQIKIQDFKGLKNKTVDLTDARNIIKGVNGIGKTSVAEAITYTLFGKGIYGEKIHNEPIENGKIVEKYKQKLELTVVANDKEYVLSKTIVNNNITEMSINNKPIKLVKEWNSEVESILGITANNFEIFSNPKYLNAIPNKKAREFIIGLISNTNDMDIVNGYDKQNSVSNEQLLLIKSNLDNNISIDMQLGMQKDNIKVIKKQLEDIDTMIASKKETLEKISEVEVEDYKSLVNRKIAIKAKITKNNTFNDDISNKLLEKNKLEMELENCVILKEPHGSYDVLIENKKKELKDVKKEFDTVNNKPLEVFAKNCNTCKRLIDGQKQLEEFKTNALNEIEDRGLALTEEIKKLKKNKEDYEKHVKTTHNQRELIKKKISILSFDSIKVDNTALQKELEEVVNSIGSYDAINTVKQEIIDLKTKKDAKEIILDKEHTKERWLSDLFSIKVKEITNKINKKLKNINVELFEIKKNGNAKEVFTISHDGITFSLFNNAKQINSGIELLNFIQSQKKINLPIIVDNAEAVNQLEKTDSQTIELNVSTNKEMEIIYG